MQDSRSQSQLILQALKAGESLTPMDALTRFNCFRLGARIADLRAEGHDIETIMERKGKKNYARYKLVTHYPAVDLINSLSPFKEPAPKETNQLFT